MTAPIGSVAQSFSLLGELDIDPAPEVYARIYARWPETERLFFRDRDHAIRNHMMFEVIEAVLDLADQAHYARGFIATERVHHVDDLQVSEEQYLGLFEILRDVVRDRLGPDWTPDMEDAWSAVLERLKTSTFAA